MDLLCCLNVIAIQTIRNLKSQQIFMERKQCSRCYSGPLVCVSKRKKKELCLGLAYITPGDTDNRLMHRWYNVTHAIKKMRVDLRL